MNKEKRTEETVLECPMVRFFRDLEKALGRKSKFLEHMTRSRIEFLKGVRALVDGHIEDLEKKADKRSGKRITKIEVEE